MAHPFPDVIWTGRWSRNVGVGIGIGDIGIDIGGGLVHLFGTLETCLAITVSDTGVCNLLPRRVKQVYGVLHRDWCRGLADLVALE